MARRDGPRTRGRAGFTLIEMLIVIIIIVIIAGTTVAMMNTWFRGQGVRRGGMVIAQAIAEAKTHAAKLHRTVFVVFSQKVANPQVDVNEDAGWVEIHVDTPQGTGPGALNGTYDGDNDVKTPDMDKLVGDGKAIYLPKFTYIHDGPTWIAISPSGYISFAGGFSEVQASTFDGIMSGPNPSVTGDIVLLSKGREYYMCMDLARASGKIRRTKFVSKQQ